MHLRLLLVLPSFSLLLVLLYHISTPSITTTPPTTTTTTKERYACLVSDITGTITCMFKCISDPFLQALGQAMNLIRIPCMELAEFANGAAQSGILSLQETTDLFLHFTARNKPSVSYPIKPRQGLKKQICHRLVGRLCSLCIGYGCCLGGLCRRVFPWTL